MSVIGRIGPNLRQDTSTVMDAVAPTADALSPPSAPMPLSGAQAAIWAELTAGGVATTFYNIADQMSLNGPLDLAAFRAALYHVHRATDVSRLRFAADDGVPVQWFDARPGRFDFALIDLSDAEDPETLVTEEFHALRLRPFDLMHGPLNRHRLIRLAPDRHCWIRCYHHLVTDGLGGVMTAAATAAAYDACKRGAPLPDPAFLPFGDHLMREAAHAAGAAGAADLAYWRARLAGDIHPHSFGPAMRPGGLPAPANPGADPAAPGARRTAILGAEAPPQSVVRPLGAARMAALDALAGRLGINARSSVMLALFLVLLGRSTGTDTPSCTTLLSNRLTRADRRTLGQFAYTVPFWTPIDPAESLEDLARRVDGIARRDLRHMRLAPVRWREAGFTPASAIARGATFNAMDFPATLGFDGLTIAVQNAVFGPLDDVLACLRTFGTAGGADMQWSFPPARIDASAVEALACSYERMLDAALADPSRPLRQVQALAAGPAAIVVAPVIDDAAAWRLEDDITRIFAGLLHNPALTPASDLTDHGLHSLLAIRALGPVTRALRTIVAAGRDVTVADILGHPSPAALAARLLDRPVVARPQASTPALATPDLPSMPAPAATSASPVAIAPPSAGATHAAFPLPAMLEGQWLARRDAGPGTTYAIGMICDLPAGTGRAALIAALTTLIGRHPTLRSTFAEAADGQVLQHVHPVPAVILHGFDDPHAMMAPFDLTTGPLIRFGWDEDTPERLRVVVDHMVFDGESRAILQRELTACLSGAPLAPAPDMAVLADAGSGDHAATEAARAFWADRLPLLPCRALTADPDRDAQPQPTAAQGRRAMTRLPAETARALGRLTGRGATPTAIWTAIVATALTRLIDDTPRLAFGFPFAGRNRGGTADAIGCFVNLLPVIAAPEDGDTLTTLGRRIGLELSRVLAVQDYPLSRLTADWSRAVPDRGPAPFDVVCTLEGDLAALDSADLAIATGKFPLLIGLMWQGDAAALNIEHDPARFGTAWVDRLARVLQAVIMAAAADPATPLGRLSLLDDADRALIDAVNATATPYPRDQGLATQLDAVLTADPARPVIADDDQVLDAGTLRARLGAVAGALDDAGVAPGAVVGLAVDRDLGGIIGLMGIIWAGGAYLPLATTFPIDTARRLLATAGCTVLLADDAGLAQWAALAPDITLVPLPSAMPVASAPDRPDRPDRAPTPRGPEDLACILYTSGSTGEPKGVAIPQRAIARLAHGGFCRPGQTMAQAAPIAFDAICLEVWAPLLNHGRVRIIPAMTMFDPPLLERCLRDGRVDVAWITASLLNRIIDDRPRTFAGLSLLMTGGEVISPGHIARLIDACPGITVLNGYGPTENGTFTTTHIVSSADLDGGPVPIGRPVANTRIHVVDDQGRPVPPGVWGDLLTAGDGLAIGYVGRPDLTARSFVTLPDIDEPLLYRTGDRVRLRADGVLEFGGRRDGQIKIRGQRIETTAIEAALTARPDVRDAMVVALGTGADQTLAALVAADTADRQGWHQAVADRLPAYMIPARFERVDRLPVNANGKADRAAAARLLAGAEAGVGETPAAAVVAAAMPMASRLPTLPDGPLERAVATAFATLFPGADIDAEADFFALGGHSLAAMRLSGLLEAATGRRPGLGQIMAGRTVRAIAAELATLPVAGPAAIPHAPGLDHPLSSGQARLWVLQKLHPGLATYSVPMVLDLRGPLDTPALDRALVALEDRHHALRTRFIARADDADGVRQTLAAPGALSPRRLRLDADAATAFIAAEITRPFDLGAEPLARAALIRLDDAGHHHRLLLVIHHAVCDGWSLPILLRDLGALYEAQLTGHQAAGAAPLPPLTRQFTDIAVWQRARLAAPEGRALIARWQARLTPVPEALALPTDHPRPALRSFAGAVVSRVLPQAATACIDRVAGAASVTPFTVMAALLQILLHRMTGQTDIALGLLVSGRAAPVPQDVVGFLVNTVVLRQPVDPAAAFATHLAVTRDRLAEAIADQDAPFEAVVASLGADRRADRNPIFDVLVTWQDDMPAMPAMGGLQVAPVETVLPFAKFDLSVHIQREGAAIRLHVEYATELFDAATVQALTDRLAVLAQALPSSAPVAALPLLTADDRRHLAAWNRTGQALDTRRSIPMVWRDAVAAMPDAPALISNDITLNHRAFAARVDALAARLHAAGIATGDVVAVALARGPDMLIAIHAVLRAGAAWCPLDPGLPERRRAHMIEDLGHPWFLCDAAGATIFPADRCVRVDAGDGPAAATPPPLPSDPEALAYVLFTSGSTGRPKGVEIAHHSVLNRILWMQATFPIGPGDVILQKTPAGFDVSVWELLWWSWTGAAVAIPPPGVERDPQALADAIAGHGVTVIHFVPAMLRAFLAAIEDGIVDAGRLAGLRLVFASGEALDAATVRRFNRLLHARFGTMLHNLYGPTEATVDVTWQPCTPWDADSQIVPIGRPVANTRVLILDGAGWPVPPGGVGEIVLAGPQVARGYRGRPGLTAERFRPDPEADHPGARVYHTGDLGRWTADGRVAYLGRADDQVKIGGVRLELAEVETALDACPGVARGLARVAARDGLTELHAYVLGADDLTPQALRAALSRHLPEAMIPSRWFRIDAVPLSANGKVDRKALTGRPFQAPARPAPVAVCGASSAEVAIAAIWRAVLPPETAFGTDDGFFEVGGTSLLLLRLHERLDARWPGAFTIAGLFAATTIAAQAARVADVSVSAVAGGPPAAEPGARDVTDGAIAIIGIGLRVAGATDLDGLWRDVAAGIDRVGALPAARLETARIIATAAGLTLPARLREAAWIEDIDGFDPRRFRFSPADAALLDPEQRLFLETALRALEDAGLGGTALDGRAVAVHVGGNANPIYRQAVARVVGTGGSGAGRSGARLEQAFALNVPSNIATRLGFLHNWHGPASLIDTACSSGLVAVDAACRDLRAGAAELAIAGAARLILVPMDATTSLSIESSTARTHAFADGSDGTGAGEGAIALVLKPLARAEADGDPIHAVILASAVNQDGASSGAAAPNPVAQAAVIRTAWNRAGAPLQTASYIEAHGTGTRLGDPIEIEGLTRAAAGEAVGHEAAPALIGSAKGNYGHLDTVAGALGLVRAVAALAHDTAPPQPFFTRPNPAIDFARAPVRVADRPTPLPDRGTRRRAGVSAFGLSGINVHAVIEAPPPPAATAAPDRGWAVVVLSAGDDAALTDYAGALHARLIADATITPAEVAHTLAHGRDHLARCAALVVDSRDDLLAALARLARGDLAGTATLSRRRDRGWTVPVWHADRDDAGNGRAAADAAAQAVLAGAVPVWPETMPTRRRHLPPAPFTRQPCRLVLPAALMAAEPVAGPARPGGTPHADRIPHAGWTAYPGGQVLALPLDDPAFWPVAEHRLNGVPTLVGMAVPALVATARGNGTSLHGTSLHDLVWRRPIRAAAAGTAASLTIGEDGAVRVATRDAGGGWTTCAEARLSTTAATQAVSVDLATEGLIALALNPFTGAEGLMTISRRWDCRRAVWMAADRSRAIARLALPDDMAADLAVWPWHPALLDVAASLLIGPGEVPRGCDAIHLHHPLPPVVMARIDRTGPGRADLVLADQAGRVCVRIDGLRFVTLAAGPGAPEILAPVWTPQAVTRPAADMLPAGTRIISDPAELDGLPADAPLVVQAPAGADAARRVAILLRAAMAAPIPRRIAVTGLGAAPFGDRAADPDQAAVAGVVMAAARETRHHDLRYLDVPAGQAMAAVAAEWAHDRPEPAVTAWQDGQRFTRGLAAVKRSGQPVWPDHGVCVVTGGSGGFAAALAEAFSNGGRVALALLSRGTPGDAVLTAAIDRLTAHGVTIRHYAADVADQGSLGAALDRVRSELGAITAVVHMAGIADGAMLAVRDMAGFDAVMAPKITGARNLEALTAGDPLTAFVVFGSVTGLAGAIGHTAYTAANAWLDGFAIRRHAAGQPALAIDWCTLGSQGMAARAGADDAPGAPVITPAQAVDAWVAALSAGVAQAVVLPAGAAAVLTAPVNAPAPEAATADTTASAMAPDMDIAAIWAQILGHPVVGPDDDFFELGGDSLSGMDIADRLTAHFGRPVSLQDLFDHSTPRMLALALMPQPAATEADTIEADAAEAAPLDARIAAIWAEILGDPTIGPDDDFFELGGDSLSGMDIADRLAAETGLAVTLSDIFDHTTPRALATALRPSAAPEPALEPDPDPAPAPADPRKAPARDRYPLAWEQRAVLQAEAIADMGTAFNLPHEIDLAPDVSLSRLRAAVAALVRRHAALRTGILPDGDDWVMCPIDPAQATPALDIQPIDHPAGTAPAAPIRPFHPDGGPLARWSLHSDPAGRLVLFFDIHHSMADAQAVDILLGDLAALYAGRTLAPVAVDVVDYGWWTATRDQAAADQARDWWRQVFPGPLPRLDLPTDRPRPPYHGHDVATITADLPAALVTALRAFAVQRRTTPFSVLLTVWAVLLARLAGHDDVTIAVPVNTRGRAGFDGAVAMHAALVPVRLAIPDDLSATALLDHVRSRHSGALAHHALPLGRLLTELKAPAMPERSPLSEVSISYMNHASVAADAVGAAGFGVRGLARPAGKNDLSVFLADHGEAMGLAIEYDTALFDAWRIAAFVPMLRTLLAALIADPDRPVGRLPLLDDAARAIITGYETRHGLAVLDPAGAPAPVGVWGALHRIGADGRVPSGIRARWRADGEIETGGRLDRVIRWQGHLLDPAAIEARLLAALPRLAGLRIAVGDDALRAAVLAAPSTPPISATPPISSTPPLSATQLHAAAAALLPPALVPVAWYRLDTLPDDPARLADLIAAATPLGTAADDTPSPSAAEAEAEAAVCAVFSEVFGRPVTASDGDFNTLGGHSLLAMRVVNRLEQTTGIRLAMSVFFSDPGIPGIARHLVAAGAGASGQPAAIPAEIAPTPTPTPSRPHTGLHPASHGQQRLYLLQQLEPDSPAWLMLFTLPCGAVDADALARALDALARRHAVLRTGFETIDGQILQRVAGAGRVAEAGPALVVDDLRHHPRRRDEALRLARREAATPFDLARPPLLRARLIRLADTDSLLLLVLHHIAGDGWSSRILLAELAALYTAACAGTQAALPPLPISYADHARRQMAPQTARHWQAATGWWRDQLAGAPGEIALPIDHPSADGGGSAPGRGATLRRDLPPALLENLRDLARRQGASLAAVGLAMVSAMLYRLTRQPDMVIGMGVAGRDSADTEGLIGFFVNVLPIRIQLDDDTEAGQLIDQINQRLMAALDRRDVPFDMVVRAVAPQRAGARQPLANVIFEYQRFGDVGGAHAGLPPPPADGGVLGDAVSGLIDATTAKHDLIVFFEDEGARARFSFEYDTGRFTASTIDLWMGFLIRIATALSARSNET